jgi:hypothetical protein
MEWTGLFRARSAGYLWLIITVGPVALTIDLIKAHLSTTWVMKSMKQRTDCCESPIVL